MIAKHANSHPPQVRVAYSFCRNIETIRIDMANHASHYNCTFVHVKRHSRMAARPLNLLAKMPAKRPILGYPFLCHGKEANIVGEQETAIVIAGFVLKYRSFN